MNIEKSLERYKKVLHEMVELQKIKNNISVKEFKCKASQIPLALSKTDMAIKYYNEYPNSFNSEEEAIEILKAYYSLSEKEAKEIIDCVREYQRKERKEKNDIYLQI